MGRRDGPQAVEGPNRREHDREAEPRLGLDRDAEPARSERAEPEIGFIGAATPTPW